MHGGERETTVLKGGSTDILISDLRGYVLSCFSNLAQTKGLQLQAVLTCENTAISCDYNRIKQICNNLVGNAIKYSYHGKCL